MRATGLTILFFLLSAGETFLSDNSVSTSFPTGNKKIVFNFPVISTPNTQKNQSRIDTAELKNSSWYGQVIKNIEESEYEIKYDELTHSYASPNRKQNLKAFYTGDNFTLLPRNDSADKWKLSLQLKGIYADADKLYAVANDPVVTQKGNNIQFNHNSQFITEYINSKEGVRQNFIINRQPAGNPKKLTVELEANKGWYINKVHDQELHFAKVEDDQLSKKIIYNSLKVWDANNKELDARFVVNRKLTAFEIEVNTTDAVYPITIDPISTTPATTLNGISTGDQFGWSVASAGDVNGDGYSDVVAGANLASASAGAAYIFLGSSTGLSATPVTTLNNVNGGSFGTSVASAGDVNGDGFSDVIIGAPAASSLKGEAYIYLGSIGVFSSTPVTTLIGSINSDRFGTSVACAGDVNGDGFSDVVVGAEGVSSAAGAAYIFLGSSGAFSTTPAATLNGAAAGNRFGISVSGAGDVNGDGYSDVVVGAYVTGAAYIFIGSSGTFSNIPVTTISLGNQFGWSVACAGDVNGDGYSDVVVGAYAASSLAGAAYIFLGSSGVFSNIPATTLNGITAGDRFGYSVACAGDVNGDGYSDVVIGAVGISSFKGAAYIFIGSSGTFSGTPATTLNGITAGDRFGGYVASTGDVNGNGISDVIVGAIGVSSAKGAAYTYHGSPDGLKTTSNWQVLEAQIGANYGLSVASAGDVNSDGFSDVLVGAYIYNQTFNDDGKAYLYLGSATGLSTIAAWTASGSMADEYFGRCVASAGDVNGDGYGDVLVGAYGYSNSQSQEGRVYLYYGSSTGLSVSAAWTYESNVIGAILGLYVASSGDVNGDGYSDIIIGAPQYDDGVTTIDEGKVYLFYGSSTIPASTPNWSVESNQTGGWFGVSVAGLGDVNGDGYCDIIFGAQLYDSGEADEGKAFAYYGSATGLPATPNWTAESNQINAQFGISVAAAGDVNGDGFGDAIIGAHLYNDPTVDEGAAFVYYGSSTGLSVAANWTAENNFSNTYYGYSVCSAGDVNGDGYSDVLIGARNYSVGQTNEGGLYCYHGSSTGLSSTVSWFFESNTAGTLLGNSVSSAGDVNGDGYSDVVAGAPYYIDPSRNGAAFVYYGNNNTGLRNNLRLYNQDLVTPIQQSSIAPALFGAGLYAKSPLGRQKGKLVWETVKNGQPFPGIPITNSTTFLSQQLMFYDLGPTGIELKNEIAKQFNSRVTYIRARVKYDPVTAITGQVYGPWRYPESFLRGNRDIGAVVLPVKFVSFVALKQNEDVLLKWITTDEITGIEYEVQHSNDGIHFQTIKNITGMGNSRNEYDWLHINPATGKNFYRIHAVENGKETFTAIRQINFDKNSRLIIYPNPAKSGSQLTVELANRPASGTLSVELFSVNGQRKAGYSIASGNNNIINITLPELPAGGYILKLIKDRKEMYWGSFVVVQ